MVVGISLNKWKATMKCRENLIELMKHNWTEFCLSLISIRFLIFGENVVGVMMSSVQPQTKDRPEFGLWLFWAHLYKDSLHSFNAVLHLYIKCAAFLYPPFILHPSFNCILDMLDVIQINARGSQMWRHVSVREHSLSAPFKKKMSSF